MHALIPLHTTPIGSETIQAVNARDIHAFLGVRKDYSDWIKQQIKRARLVENRDFTILPLEGEYPTAGQPRVEYHVTLDAGKRDGHYTRPVVRFLLYSFSG